MGRYYSGDINGKFWFGVQNSDAADRFGVTGDTPSYLSYYFDESNLEEVTAEIESIKENLGDQLQVIEAFFAKNNGYNDDMLVEANITRRELSEYADLKLGIQIKECIEKNNECAFEAEC